MKKRLFLVLIMSLILCTFSGCMRYSRSYEEYIRSIKQTLMQRNTYNDSDYEEAILVLEYYFDDDSEYTQDDYNEAVKIVKTYVEEKAWDIEEAVCDLDDLLD